MSRSKKIIIFFGLAAIFVLGLATNFLGSLVWGMLLLFAAAVFFYFYPEPGFYALVAYLPFQLALNLSADVDLMSGRLLILLLPAAWLLRAIKEKKQYLFDSHISLALMLFFAVSLLSVFVAQNPGWGLRKILFFLTLFPLFFLTRVFIQNRAQVKKLIVLLVGTAASSAVLALGQFLAQFIFGVQEVANFLGQSIAPRFWGVNFGQLVTQNPSWYVSINGQTLMRAIGLFPDPHMLSFFLGLTSPLVLVLAAGVRKKRLLLSAIYCLMFAVLVLTFSRGGYLGLILSVLAMAFLAWPRLGRPAKTFLFSVGLLVVTFLFIFGATVTSRLFSSFDTAEGSNVGRLAIWRQSLAQAGKNPFLGVGLGNYPLAINFNEDYRSAVTSHSLYLDLLAETGIFGLAAWLWFIVAAGRDALRSVKTPTFFTAALAIGIFGSLAYFSLHAFFETPIFNVTVLAFLMIVAGLAANLNKIEKSEN